MFQCPHCHSYNLDSAPMLPSQEIAHLRHEKMQLLRELGTALLDNAELQQHNADLMCEIDGLLSELQQIRPPRTLHVLQTIA
jgi:hypothetical protein